jgi:hypothetical protein
LTFVAGFKLVYAPLFDVEEFLVQGHWRGRTLRVWAERPRIVRRRRRLLGDHGFSLSVSWNVDRDTVGGIVGDLGVGSTAAGGCFESVIQSTN